MANILDQIIRDKRSQLEREKQQVPLENLQKETENTEKCRNFYKEVTKRNRRGLNVIAEVKKASPSAGVICEDFDPVRIAGIYQNCHADAISVLTEEKYFQGKLEYLTRVKQAVNVPVLRKDFIIDPYQIYQSRAAGADAILLIGEALAPGEIMDLMICAAELGLTCLIEVHNVDTLLKLRSVIGFPKKGYSVLGINNRNLETMRVDINNTGRLTELLEPKTKFVTESGIKTRQDVRKLMNFGASACLIGQTLCEKPNIETAFKELFGG